MYQFIHIQAYARQEKDGRSVDFVIGEADRHPAHSMHVENPLPSEVIYGLPLAAVREQHDRLVASTKQVTSGGVARGIRTTQKTLLTVVASHPIRSDEARADPDKARAVELWEHRTIRWLSLRFGSQIVSVVRHADEPYRHLHAFVLPAKEMRALELHPGYSAKAAVMRGGASTEEERVALNRHGDLAFKNAMREWQDDYYKQVGAPSGLARIGPAKRRLSRQAWRLEAKSAQALKTTVDRANTIRSNAERWLESTKGNAQAILSAAAAEASRVRSEADEIMENAARRESEAQIFELRARRAWGAAKAELERLSDLANELSALEDSKSIIAKLDLIEQTLSCHPTF
ncbi:hypothetical protein [Rhizobium sp. RAF56]|uniref:hypothetical protein n=1 Tax=Rhizobium sp. RAF56 TaxID=3233062 RepID=UPI003F9CBCFB